MSNEYELARDNRQDLIFTKEQLLAPLLPGMEQPPHPMRLGDTEKDYYVGALTNPGTSAGAERAPWSETGTADGAGATGDSVMTTSAARRGHVSTGEAVTFWILAPLALIGAIGMVVGAQRRALRAVAGADHALPGRVLRRCRPGRSSAWCRSSSTPARS